MTSKRPRITLLLTDELLDSLRSFSKESGMSVSSIVVQFLTPSIPVMKDLENVFIEAKKGSAGNGIGLVNSVVKAANRMVDSMNKECGVMSDELKELSKELSEND